MVCFRLSDSVSVFLNKLAVAFSVEQLLNHLQQVLETHEVNWKHVLCFLSTLLVYNPLAQPSLRGTRFQGFKYLTAIILQ